jgi:hypothetical protein
MYVPLFEGNVRSHSYVSANLGTAATRQGIVSNLGLTFYTNLSYMVKVLDDLDRTTGEVLNVGIP